MLVTVTHLEMLAPSWLRPKPPPAGVAATRVGRPLPELNRFFYTAVGGRWHWHERLAWTYADWLRYLDRPESQTWIVTVDGTPAGYFELETQGTDVEIVYFGLLPAFAEEGIGGWALSESTRRAWDAGASRVWVHTCDLDHPRALTNYLARGFRVFKTVTEEENIPAKPVGPWPGW